VNVSAREALEMLERQGPNTSPERFKQVYDYILAASQDRDILARLMWVAGMYLDRHPGEFRLPRAISEEFLASDDFDRLLGGLKAIRHSTASTSEIIAHFLAVMKRDTWDERYAGLHQLAQMVCESGARVLTPTEQTVLDDVRVVLEDIASHAPDEHARDLASRCSLAMAADQGHN